MKRRVRLAAGEARRIALAAQDLHRDRPAAAPDARHFRRALQALRVLQLDFVNVLVPAHYLILWSRLGAFDRERFDRFVYGSGDFTEQWAHEASIVPGDAWPLLAHRRAAWEPSKNNPLRRIRNRARYLDRVLEQVQRDGALTSADLPPVPGPKRRPGDWHRSVPRWALEYHFARGDLAVARRLGNFQRVYDLPERLIPRRHLDAAVDRQSADREMLRRASQALGVATLQDLADYFRMSPREAAPRIDELVEAGALSRVAVENWPEPAYLSAAAQLPRAIEGASLLSPFDPVVWYRPRAERLFGFHYRIEIYVPAARRKWGYYVLPFRLGERIVARVDLKADRRQGRLLVLAVHEEPGVAAGECADALAGELQALREWLALDTIRVTRSGNFARALAAAVGN
ncbi:MAG TPA: crosslink repair DNA glycosylase YcaQ family protein [Pelomicrobium sp.]|nr:crosslink repair DNA glycosylase YcaQ family protein [Pelomicrobium sp.]